MIIIIFIHQWRAINSSYKRTSDRSIESPDSMVMKCQSGSSGLTCGDWGLLIIYESEMSGRVGKGKTVKDKGASVTKEYTRRSCERIELCQIII